MARRAPRVLREIVFWLAFAAVLTVARASFADHYRIPSGSMEPTVEVGDHVFVTKASYGLRVPLTDAWLLRWSLPARGDVVVLESPDDGIVLLKRVVALEGDLVEVVRGEVRIDGRPEGEHSMRIGPTGGPDFGPIRVPSGHALVLGDNRSHSRDSRSFGFVRLDAIFGRAEAVVSRDGSIVWSPL
jgi:signal peptidase I